MPGIDRNRAAKRVENTLKEAANDQPSSNYHVAIKSNRLYQDMNNLLRLEDKDAILIPRENIYPNPINRPYMGGYDESAKEAMKASILEMGLMHNLVVLADEHGKYRLISGEKRWTAIASMTQEEYDMSFREGILCKVIPYIKNLSEQDEKIMLLSANVLVFSSGTPDLKQVRDLISLYTQKGYKKKEMVDFLNNFLEKNIVTIYKMIDESRAVPELVGLYEANRMSRAALQCLGGLSEEEQKQAYVKIIADNDSKIDEKLAKGIKKSIKQSKKQGIDIASSNKENSLAFLKMKKSLDGIITNINKGKKTDTKDMNELEKELALAKIEKIQTELRQLEEELRSKDKG